MVQFKAKYPYIAINAKRLPCDNTFQTSECKGLGMRCYPASPTYVGVPMASEQSHWHCQEAVFQV